MSRVKHVESRQNELFKGLRRLLTDPAACRRQQRAWLEGDHLCRALLERGGAPVQAVIGASAWERPALRALAEAAPEVVVVPDALLADLSGLESPPPLGYLIALDAATAVQPGLRTVVLDRLQDPGNVGSILRTAAAMGFAQVCAIKGTVALWSPKVLRAGMGAHFGLRLVEGLAPADLDALAVPLVVTHLQDAQPLPGLRLPDPLAWVLGHEGQGVSDELSARCTQRVKIPQPGGEESLNVAAAAAICLYASSLGRVAG